MKELSNKLLPIQIEGELNKEWDFLSEEYIGLLARTGRGMKYSLSFPVESHVSVTSPRTGIVWNIMIMLEDPKVIMPFIPSIPTNMVKKASTSSTNTGVAG